MRSSRESARTSAPPVDSAWDALRRMDPRIPMSGGSSPHQGRGRRVSPRRVSPFNIMLALLVFAIAIVLYIGNIIAVNQLMRDIGELETRHRRILQEQEILRAQVNRMSSLDRIQKLAEDQLQLKIPTTAPLWITVDSSRIEDVEQATADSERRF